MDKYLPYDTFPFRHDQFLVCFIMLSLFKIWTNMDEVCLSIPLQRYLSQLHYWHNVNSRVYIGFGEESFYQSLRLFFN